MGLGGRRKEEGERDTFGAQDSKPMKSEFVPTCTVSVGVT